MASSGSTRLEISDWFVECALLERPIGETVIAFADRLQDLGFSVQRINCSTFQSHQIMGAVDSTWEQDTGHCETIFVPKSVLVRPDNIERPVGTMARGTSVYERYCLEDPRERSRFPVLEELFAKGYTDYILLKQTYGRHLTWLDFTPDAEGVYGSFATKRSGGFSETEIEGLRSFWRPFALFLKTTTEEMLSAKLLEAYVGNLPAQNILAGMTERGDGNRIKCALWYSDLRGSTRLSASLPSDKYLELLNNYFDCTAGSVIEHGGEVLKLIGDGVMSIFPVDGDNETQACSLALSAAVTSLSKAADLHRDQFDVTAEFYFGIGLHLGEVILGNVGTENRLDMTVTGHSANQVTRIESLTKLLGLSVLASPQFHGAHPKELTSVGKYPVPDFGGMTEIFSLLEK
ncbi:adenylate/guanylate cyclase domain-containing protein [Roseibium sp. SCP14]|uniref:adenylate/guanylate cyclase domain-containing protein n=1 Tax=Roseibium sp. SCP14 TaxID=3141375 RepID=UPI00333996BF